MASLRALWTWLSIIRDFVVGSSYLFTSRLLPQLRPARQDLTGKTAIVIGANSGVGYGIALNLAQQGALVVLACRNEEKAAKAHQDIPSNYVGAKVDIVLLDTSSFASVRKFADTCRDTYATIDILCYNAGISAPPDGQEYSEDGFEFMYQTNFLSSFLLTHLLENN